MPFSLSSQNDRNRKAFITERSLKSYFSSTVSPSLIGRWARKLGLKQRKCRFNPVSFLTAVIMQAGLGSKFTITAICARYAALSGQSMNNKPFHNKLKKPEVTQLTGEVLKRYSSILSLTLCRHKGGAGLLKTLQRCGLNINDIECIDGSYWHIDKNLAAVYPGARTAAQGEELRNTYDSHGEPVKKKPGNAQIGMQTVYSLVTGMVKSVLFTAGTADERTAVTPDINNPTLKIMDAGYVSYELLRRISAAGSYFMLRGKYNMSGTVTACFLNGKPVREFIGMNLQEPLLRAFRPHDILDMNLTLNNGFNVRLLRVWSKNKGTVSYLVTNISRQCLPAKYAATIQKLRWSVEILFKTLKSGVNLRGVKTRYLTIVYTIIQASLIASIMKYLIYLYLDGTRRYFVSMYKVFVNCDMWWAQYCKSLIKSDMRELKANLTLINTLANQYEKSRTSKKRKLELKSLEAVIEFLAQVPEKAVINANFSHA